MQLYLFLGVVTGAIGGPYLIWLMATRRAPSQ